MKPNPVHRLPAPLEAAVQRLKLAAREAAERTIESLGLAALASTNAFHRDGLLGAQFELNRKSAVFALAFNDAFDERVLREVAPRTSAAAAAVAAPDSTAPPAQTTDWAAFSLVEDKEVEAQISAERFGMDIAYACEWELRELDGYVASLLGDTAAAAAPPQPDGRSVRERNPLRPDLVGHAMIRGIEAVSERPDVRKVLSAEFSRSLGALLPATYAATVTEMRNAGVQPLGLAVRTRSQRSGGGGSGTGDDVDSRAGALSSERGNGLSGPRTRTGGGTGSGVDSRLHGTSRAATGFGMSTSGGAPLGRVDPALMALIRRLAHHGGSGGGGSGGGGSGGRSSGHAGDGDAGWSDFGGGGGAEAVPDGYGAPANVIRAHREELRQASKGALDHMVIDVIGFLFDHILADAKVPPQMARQIARLQLPVLRAALGDPSFFSSRRHPVRRFVNRIASLGAAFDDFQEDGAKAFLQRVRDLVNEVVDGDFEHVGLYEQKLRALETLAAEVAAQDVLPDAALLAEKEDQQRLRQLYAQRLTSELKDVDAPAFLRSFLGSVWSQVLMRASEKGGAEGPLVQRLRAAGRELYLSVQAKATPAHRKAFLAELPRLMQDLTEGMNLIGWPETERRAFFGLLMPAHAEALKSAAGRTLDINLMARKVEGALQRPLPSRDDLRALPPNTELPVLTEALFTPAEAEAVGLVQEAAVDWNGSVDIDLGAAEPAASPTPQPPPEAQALAAPAMAAPGEPAEPTEGRALAEHVQVGVAYRMHIEGAWHKVKLSHVSAARSFFIFTHGARHKKTVSLTQRMLVKLCETGRLKAFESAWLIDRATARARRQLESLRAAGA